MYIYGLDLLAAYNLSLFLLAAYILFAARSISLHICIYVSHMDISVYQFSSLKNRKPLTSTILGTARQGPIRRLLRKDLFRESFCAEDVFVWNPQKSHQQSVDAYPNFGFSAERHTPKVNR